ARAEEILEANAADVEAAADSDLTPAFRDKMRLDPARVAAIAEGVRAIVALRDPVGEVIEGFRLPNDLDVRRVRVPLGVVAVIYAASGNCHVYVDATADLDMAHDITVNAKVQRPGVCNSAETLLVHRDVAPAFLPRVLGTLREAGVELRADARARAAAGDLAD